MKIVYVAMCADLLHHGHLNIIKEALKYGKVIIGLLTDKAIEQYKKTPILTYEQRKLIISNLKGIDKVVEQTTLDYTDNLNKIRPDYVVHGSDWKTGRQKEIRNDVVKILKTWGGTVIDIEYTEGISSTILNQHYIKKSTKLNFQNKLVKKPWGEEYLLYESEDIALWHLKINQGKQTSLHAHPNKKTGLIVVDGGVQTSFLTDNFKLFPSDKIMIRQGVFHSSQAVVGNCEILEIETPNNKTDIVRLEDEYGRKGKPYENEKHYTNYTNQYKFLLNGQLNYIGSCKIQFLTVNNKTINNKYRTFIVLKGTITSNDFVVCGPGDVLYYDSLKLMLEKFNGDQDIYVLGITNE